MMLGTTPEAHGSVLFLVGVSVSEFSFSSVFQRSVSRYSKGGSVWRSLELLRRPRPRVTSPLTLTGRPPGVATAAGRAGTESRRGSREGRTAVDKCCAARNTH